MSVGLFFLHFAAPLQPWYDTRLDVIDGVRVRRLEFQSDSLAREGLNKNLHASTKTKDSVNRRLLLDIVIRQSPPVLKLFASKD